MYKYGRIGGVYTYFLGRREKNHRIAQTVAIPLFEQMMKLNNKQPYAPSQILSILYIIIIVFVQLNLKCTKYWKMIIKVGLMNQWDQQAIVDYVAEKKIL